MLKDSNPSTALNLTKLEYILTQSQKYLGLGKKFALLGFDSCLMSMVEVGYELNDIADVIVASEGNVPTSGWDYEEILKNIIEEINNNGAISNKTFASIIVDKFIEYSKDYVISGRSVNISACDLGDPKDRLASAIYNLAETFNTILNAPIGYINDSEKADSQTNALIKSRITDLIHNSHYYSQTFMYEQAVDLRDFVTSLSSNCELIEKELELICGGLEYNAFTILFKNYLTTIKSQCKEVWEKVDEFVFSNGYCGSEFQFSSGVSIFFPWTLLAFSLVYQKYKNLEFSKNNKAWINFIENFTKLTYRSKNEPKFMEGLDFLEWSNDLAAHKDVSYKDVSYRDVSYRDVSYKDGDQFYGFFKRFRNHSIYYDVNSKK